MGLKLKRFYEWDWASYYELQGQEMDFLFKRRVNGMFSIYQKRSSINFHYAYSKLTKKEEKEFFSQFDKMEKELKLRKLFAIGDEELSVFTDYLESLLEPDKTDQMKLNDRFLKQFEKRTDNEKRGA